MTGHPFAVFHIGSRSATGVLQKFLPNRPMHYLFDNQGCRFASFILTSRKPFQENRK
jgi:hypothetical protein